MVIQSKKVWLADQFVPAAIEVNDGRITAILPYGTKDVDDDYGDKRIVPGFMDIHCHGAYEFDTNDANEDGLRYWAEHIVSEGVTSFLATTITQSVEVLTNVSPTWPMSWRAATTAQRSWASTSKAPIST